MRHLLIAAALLIPLPLMAQEGAGPTITKSEIRSGEPRRTHGRLRDVIWEMFEREDLRRDTSPTRALDHLWLRTRARGTEVPGLCRFDGVSVEFSPAGRRQRGADTPVRAVGLRANAFFHFRSPPTRAVRSAPSPEQLPADDECRSLNVAQLHFFPAPSAATANDGYLAFGELRRALREAPDLPLRCELYPNDSLNCRDLILSFGADGVQGIDDCEAPDDRQLCYRVSLEDRSIDIYVTRLIIPGPPPNQVVGARLRSWIVLSHPRPD